MHGSPVRVQATVFIKSISSARRGVQSSTKLYPLSDFCWTLVLLPSQAKSFLAWLKLHLRPLTASLSAPGLRELAKYYAGITTLPEAVTQYGLEHHKQPRSSTSNRQPAWFAFLGTKTASKRRRPHRHSLTLY